MGCIGCIIALGEAIYQQASKLKERKNLRSFSLSGIIKVDEISKKFKYIRIDSVDKIVILDYNTMKVKYETPYMLSTVISNFSSSDNTYSIEFKLFEDQMKCVKLKIAEDKITEISDEIKTKNSPLDKLNVICKLENGNAFVFKASEFESSPDLPMAYVDSNGKSLKEIEFPKKINNYSAGMSHKWHNDKYIVFNRVIFKGQLPYSLTLELYEISTLKKIGEMEAKQLENREIVTTAVSVVQGDANTLIVSVVYKIFIVDIATFQVQKEVSLCKGASFANHIKAAEPDTFFSMTKDYRFFKWKKDGTVVSSNCWKNGMSASGSLPGFFVINNEKELLYGYNSGVRVDELDDKPAEQTEEKK